MTYHYRMTQGEWRRFPKCTYSDPPCKAISTRYDVSRSTPSTKYETLRLPEIVGGRSALKRQLMADDEVDERIARGSNALIDDIRPFYVLSMTDLRQHCVGSVGRQRELRYIVGIYSHAVLHRSIISEDRIDMIVASLTLYCVCTIQDEFVDGLRRRLLRLLGRESRTRA